MEQRVLIDYLTISFKYVFGGVGYSLFRLFGEPQIDPLTGLLSPHGWEVIKNNPFKLKGLICGVYRNGIHIWFAENVCMMNISGKGCRTLEDEFDWNWEVFFDALKHDLITRPTPRENPRVHISRLDVTCDLLNSNDITIEKLNSFIKEGRYVCKSQRFLTGIGSDEKWIYFGSPTSERRLRIYDKAMEQGVDYPWLRFEFQLRNKSALSFLLNYYDNHNIPENYYGVMHDFLIFTKNAQTDIIMTA